MARAMSDQPQGQAPTGARPGPAILSSGFRPFFLLAAAWAAAAMLLWTGMLTGAVHLPTAFDPLTWHAHEFLFGYMGAVIAGFMLTAVPNWTGRPPLKGAALAVMVLFWLAGRAAIASSALLPWQAVAIADLSLGLALLAFLAREVVAGRNWRNLVVIGLIGTFVVANALVHFEAARDGHAFDGWGMRLGLGALLMLVALIGGRIIPAFTRNRLSARGAPVLPPPFGRGDAAVLALTALALLGLVALPQTAALGWIMLAAAAGHLWRLSRWCGWQVRGEPLLWVLHLGYLALGLGFIAEAAALWGFLAPGAARHVWLAGAIGLMSLAVMSRATLGHTGRGLKADPLTTMTYLALAASVVARVAAAAADHAMPLLLASAGLWVLAFGGFLLGHAPSLLRPRLDG